MATPLLVIVENFCGGSHARFVELIAAFVQERAEVVRCTLPAKKWHWRLRASALWAAAVIPRCDGRTGTLVASSMLNLAELLALRPDVRNLRLVVYFHENQLVFPIQRPAAGGGLALTSLAGGGGTGAAPEDRDFQFGWAQVLTCAVASVVAFNSAYNRDSFLAAIPALCRLIPDKSQRPAPGPLVDAIRARSVVAHFPVPRRIVGSCPVPPPGARLRIVWPHRWEYDKGPDDFFAALQELHGAGQDFEVAVVGEAFAEVPPVFAAAHAWLTAAGKVCHWGFVPSADAYHGLLTSCDVVVSTALHEFFGVSTVEAVQHGCWPLVPEALAYPELLVPTASELAESSGAEGRVRAILAAGAAHNAQAFALAGSGEGAAGGGRPGDGEYRAPPRDAPSPHLYRTGPQLRKALTRLSAAPGVVRAWKREFLASAADGAAGSGPGAGEGGDARAMKRPRAGGGTAPMMRDAVARFHDLTALYMALLL